MARASIRINPSSTLVRRRKASGTEPAAEMPTPTCRIDHYRFAVAILNTSQKGRSLWFRRRCVGVWLYGSHRLKQATRAIEAVAPPAGICLPKAAACIRFHYSPRPRKPHRSRQIPNPVADRLTASAGPPACSDAEDIADVAPSLPPVGFRNGYPTRALTTVS
jgi:hypothetical protein